MPRPRLHNFAVTKKDQTLHAHARVECAPFVPRQLDPDPETQLVLAWYTRTCYTFPRAHALFLRERVGEQALSCDFLMGALLASTSLHLACEAGDVATAKHLVTASLQHQNRAIAGLQQNLQTLNPHNCDDVFLATILMMMCAFLSCITPLAQTTSRTNTMMCAFHLLKGAQEVAVYCFSWLFQGRAVELFGTGDKARSKAVRLDADAMIARLRLLNTSQSISKHKQVLDELISNLELGFSGQVDGIAWLMSAGADYIHLLRFDDVVAKALLMHYGTLLARVEGIWWARIVGMKLVDELSRTLEGSLDDCASMTAWCRASIDS